MSERPFSLAGRFRRHVLASGLVDGGDGVVVALSGGADSVVLLHLLRFTARLPALRVCAAHVDHGMRPTSPGDADWVRGICRAWGVPLHVRRLDPPPASEAQARRLRYGFLEEVRQGEGARWVLTAHHADDQAETVLFRAARGSGLAGLQGIRETRAPGVWRPLLPFGRGELRAHAEACRLTWRDDPTNRDPLTRNVLRHRVLPGLEAAVPGAGRALAGLARHAQADEAAWGAVEALLLESVGLVREEDGVSLDRAALATLAPPLRHRVLRGVLRRLGHHPSEAGTRRAVEFTSPGPGGGAVPLGGGLVLRRELDRIRVIRDAARPADQEAVLADPRGGEAAARVGGVPFRVRWGAPEGAERAVALARAALAFPLTVRGWRPGDRIRLPYGSKKLKKVLLEARVPRGERYRIPVLVDALGAVLWVPGVARAAGTEGREGDDVLTIGITHAETD